MAEENSIKLFGFEIKRAKSNTDKLKSVVPPQSEDGAGYVTASGSYYGQYVDLDGSSSKDNYSLIMKYRGVATHPEVDAAIEDIVNEAIVVDEEAGIVSIGLDDIEATDQIKKSIQEEFKGILSMLDFKELGHDIFKRWYTDGRIYHHLVVPDGNEKGGIQEIRFIDSLKMRKVKEIKKEKDPKTNTNIVKEVKEYYIYQEKPGSNANNNAVKFHVDSVSYVTSGLLDESRKKVVSHLHKAIKPINQLRMMEDSLVIYRLARAPERRIFYVDVGNLPKGKAEEYLKSIMTKFRNKLVYDANTGELKDDRKHMSMLEDFWLPRREGGRGTEVTSLPGGENLGQIDDIIYFQKRVYRALNVPINRLEQEQQFSLGRSTEISRDEVKFQKFIDRLRNKFASLFIDILKKQLILKKIITEADWDTWKEDIKIEYSRDNYFSELKESELLKERIQTLDMIQPHVGEYFTKDWVMKNILKLSEEDTKELDQEVDDENDDEVEKAEKGAQPKPDADSDEA